VSPWLGIAVLVGVVAWNAFFVAAEYAFVAARPSRLGQLADAGSRRARRALALQSDPTRFISSVQVAITMSSLAAGAVGEPAVRGVLDDVLAPLGEIGTRTVAVVLSVVLAFAIVTAITVVLGEIVPKTLSLVRTEQVALASVDVVVAFSAVFRPFVATLDQLSRLVTRAIGLPAPTAGGQAHSEEELRLILAASRDEGILEREEGAMLSRVLDFADTETGRVMVPRPEVVVLRASATVGEACDLALADGHTRHPVVGGDRDDLLGVVDVRDLLRLVREGREREPLAAAARDGLVVPETRPLDDLLEDFRRAGTHFAVVVDEYGDLAGVVTLTDLSEEIIGEVIEGGRAQRGMVILRDDRALVPGSYPIEDFDERFGTNLAVPEVRSLGGLVFTRLGRVPRVGESLETPGVRLTVREMDGPRIASLEAHLLVGPPESGE
jgi:CBS domain containing-hemolysin-like protein